MNNKIMGGESYQVNKSPRSLFSATTSGNKTLDKGEKVMLNAELIENRPAIIAMTMKEI